MRNAVKNMTNSVDPCTENHFLSFIEISEQNGSLCGSHSGSLSDYHWLRRPLQRSLHRSCVAPLGNLYVIFGPKIFSLPVPTRPATRTFCHYPTRSRPEVKNHYPSVSDSGLACGPFYSNLLLLMMHKQTIYIQQMIYLNS